MKIKYQILLAITMLLAHHPALHAEAIKGEIRQASTDGRSFYLTSDTPDQGKKSVKVWLGAETRFKGLNALSEMVRGDQVTVTGEKNRSTGRWEASVIERQRASGQTPSQNKTQNRAGIKSFSGQNAQEILSSNGNVPAAPPDLTPLEKIQMLQNQLSVTSGVIEARKTQAAVEDIQKFNSTQKNLDTINAIQDLSSRSAKPPAPEKS